MQRMMGVLIVSLLLASSVSCGICAKSDAARIEDTIEGFFSAYNAADFDQCLGYLMVTTEEEREATKAALAVAHAASGDIRIDDITDITIDGTTATAKVTATIQDEPHTQRLALEKVDGTWKLSFEGIPLPSTPT